MTSPNSRIDLLSDTIPRAPPDPARNDDDPEGPDKTNGRGEDFLDRARKFPCDFTRKLGLTSE